METVTDKESDLWRTYFDMTRQLDLALERRLQADASISRADFEILVSLHNDPRNQLRAGRIADLIGWEKSRVSHQLTRMEGRGLIKREECGDDARGVWVALTAEGRSAVLSATRDHRAALRELFFDALDSEQKDALLDISGRVLDAINPPVCSEDSDETN